MLNLYKKNFILNTYYFRKSKKFRKLGIIKIFSTERK